MPSHSFFELLPTHVDEPSSTNVTKRRILSFPRIFIAGHISSIVFVMVVMNEIHSTCKGDFQ